MTPTVQVVNMPVDGESDSEAAAAMEGASEAQEGRANRETDDSRIQSGGPVAKRPRRVLGVTVAAPPKAPSQEGPELNAAPMEWKGSGRLVHLSPQKADRLHVTEKSARREVAGGLSVELLVSSAPESCYGELRMVFVDGRGRQIDSRPMVAREFTRDATRLSFRTPRREAVRYVLLVSAR
jgi:hypothetical protein